MNAETKIKAATLADALAIALPTLGGAIKNANNPAFKSKYADLGAVIDAVRPVAEHGVWYLQESHDHDAGALIETFFIGHGEKISAGKVFVPAAKNNAHGFGSALTYARRYGLQTAFGLPTEDDDGNAAANAPAEVLNDNEWAEIVQLIEATNTDTQRFCAAFNVGSVKDLPRAAYKKAKAQLTKKLEDMKDRVDA